MEIFSEYLFLSPRTSSEDHSTTQTVNVLVFRSLVVTYHLGHSITRQLLSRCRLVLAKKFGDIIPSPSWVCHSILDEVIDRMLPEVEATAREVENCEQFVFKLAMESQNELLHRMQVARAWMVLYRSRLWPKSTITHNLVTNLQWRRDFLSDVPQPYWRDIDDHVARMVDSGEHPKHLRRQSEPGNDSAVQLVGPGRRTAGSRRRCLYAAHRHHGNGGHELQSALAMGRRAIRRQQLLGRHGVRRRRRHHGHRLPLNLALREPQQLEHRRRRIQRLRATTDQLRWLMTAALLLPSRLRIDC